MAFAQGGRRPPLHRATPGTTLVATARILYRGPVCPGVGEPGRGGACIPAMVVGIDAIPERIL